MWSREYLILPTVQYSHYSPTQNKNISALSWASLQRAYQHLQYSWGKVNFQLFLESCSGVFQPAHVNGDKGVEAQGQWAEDGVHRLLS